LEKLHEIQSSIPLNQLSNAPKLASIWCPESKDMVVLLRLGLCWTTHTNLNSNVFDQLLYRLNFLLKLTSQLVLTLNLPTLKPITFNSWESNLIWVEIMWNIWVNNAIVLTFEVIYSSTLKWRIARDDAWISELISFIK
jgi:hypothetical protein